MISHPFFSRSLRTRPFTPILWLFTLCFLWTSCTSAPPSPAQEETTSSQTTGENQKIYLPLFHKNGDPFPIPTDAPLTEWTVAGGVLPVMPGAQAGGEMDGNYIFTTSASIADIKAYYTQELEARGWESLSMAESPDKKELLFQLGEAKLTVKMDFLPEQNLSYVVLEG